MISDIENIWNGIEKLGPIVQFLFALLVFLVGYLFSGVLSKIVVNLLKKIRLNQAFKRMGWEEALKKADISIDISKFFGEIVKWIFIIIVLMLSCEMVGLKGFSSFLGRVVAYLPNIIIAGLIFVLAVFLSDFSYRVAVVSANKARVNYSKLLGTGVRWAIWIFAILAILLQLGITSELVKAMVYGLVSLFVISFGLAFGLGGKDLAAEILKDFKDKISND